MDGGDLAQRLAARTLALLNIPSISRGEAALHAHIAEEASRFLTIKVTDEPAHGILLERGKPRLILAGHFDTVPEQGNLEARQDGDVIHGLGASDMKGALAVMLGLAGWLERDRPETAMDVGFLFFAREELPIGESALPAMFARCPQIKDADLVLVMEPTDNTLQIGCLGNLNAELLFHGKSAHSARPWQGENALHKAILGLQAIANGEPEPVEVGGLTYTEVLSLTKIEGGIAGNVIPDRVACHLNYRYAPNRSPEEAEARVKALAPDSADVRVIGNAPPARAAIDNPLVRKLRQLGDLKVEAKQAWTPVAEFSAEGLDAVNLGPGMSRYAHQQDEQVRVSDLVTIYRLLQRFMVEVGDEPSQHSALRTQDSGCS